MFKSNNKIGYTPMNSRTMLGLERGIKRSLKGYFPPMKCLLF